MHVCSSVDNVKQDVEEEERPPLYELPQIPVGKIDATLVIKDIVKVFDFKTQVVITTVKFVAKCSRTLNVVKGITSDAVEINKGDFISIESKEDDCLADLEKCSDSGVTFALRLKVTVLVENSVIFSSGAENDEGYGRFTHKTLNDKHDSHDNF